MSEVELLSIVAADGYRLACRRWRPPEGATPRGLVVYLHGIQSHGGWYEASARHLAGAGFTVYLPDRRGSGLNAADRGHAESWEQLAADVVAVEDRALAEAPGRAPLALVGVSWGGKLPPHWRPCTAGRRWPVPGVVRARCAARSGVLRWRPGRRMRFPIPLGDPHLFTATSLAGPSGRRRVVAARPRRRFSSEPPPGPGRGRHDAMIHVPTYWPGRRPHHRQRGPRRGCDWAHRTARSSDTDAPHIEFEPEPQPILPTWRRG